MAVPNWSPKPPNWSNDSFNLLIKSKIENVPPQTLEEIITNSAEFQIDFPVDTGRCMVLRNNVQRNILERNINSVYPLIHENALELCCKFLVFKTKHGTSKEKNLYKDMTLLDFIERLLRKRAVMFVGIDDLFLLLNRERGIKNWETIGTEEEAPPLVIEHCLSYDEIKLSVFLSVSSYTYFVNIGDRNNMAKFATNRENIMDEGIIIGMIGPRLKKSGVMEYQEIVISPNQNTEQNGYGRTVQQSTHKLFAEFYEEHCLNYQETLDFRNTLPSNDERYTELKGDLIFDNHYYYKRLTISIDTLLIEANHRAKSAGKTAYVHVVGLGLGVWKISRHQEKIYMDTFAERIQNLGKHLHAISDICFSYINPI
ncbi:unnamed protein product [Phaedon cochleariae]|uniref:Uncharacterized protein n=1 Tax=Phaedon cochleariae TaxID=80249 RepID=A0A9N9X235_PHACE|nr:unnamed protein product [Phaedon cochleariae]